MTRPVPDPPRLSEWIARLAAGRHRWDEAVGGDLREEFAAVTDRLGREGAFRWYRRQARDLIVDRLADTSRGCGRALISLVKPQGDHPMRAVLTEIRPALRSLVRQPLSTAAIVVTLAVGLGMNAAVFGMVDALALRPFTFTGVDEMVLFSENSTYDFPQETVSPANFAEWRAEATSFSSMAAFTQSDVNMAGGEQADRVGAAIVSGDFFVLLGIAPAHGRLLAAVDEPRGNHQQVVLADGLWRRRFGGETTVVGRSVQLDGQPFTVVGIAPPGFDFPTGSQLWTPLGFSPDDWADRRSQYLTVVARRKPGVTFEAAAAEMATIYGRQQTAHPAELRDRRLNTHTFTNGMVDFGLPRVLGLWQAAALFLLAIGIANAVNLLLARGADRRRELALRTALGAGRARIMRQLLVESLLLALIATPAALVVAAVTVGIIRGAMPPELVRYVTGWLEMGVDWRLALATLAAAAVTSLVLGLLPALQATNLAVVSSLREGGRSMTGGRHRLRRALVVAQIALALPLLIASGMAALGAQQLANGPQGYDPDGLLRLRVAPPEADYPDAESRRVLARRLVEDAGRLPGITGAASTTALPSGMNNMRRALTIDGRPADPDQPPTFVDYRAVSADYHAVMRMPVFEGRSFTAMDREGTQPVAVVSRTFASRFWPDGSPVGARVRLGEDAAPWLTVVGVTGDTIHDWFSSRNQPTIYVPVEQWPSSQIHLVMRTDGDPEALAGAARGVVAAIDPNLAPFDVSTMRDAVRVRTTGIRFIGGMMAGFGSIALLLAAIGIYSVMAFFVSERRQEIGIRMALGATARRVLVGTALTSGWMTAIGLAIGLTLGVLLGRLVENALFGVIALDVTMVVAVGALLGVVAVAASLIPARQAARVDPVTAMRSE
ncbi:MAG TPA: ABC transporter permease [Vicinamibacterales bacterium]|nr:ABC transporter permease [Vicinamibacterales bacterium]